MSFGDDMAYGVARGMGIRLIIFAGVVIGLYELVRWLIHHISIGWR